MLANGSVVIVDVAPRVGAWIETSSLTRSDVEGSSPPAWGRGLKHELAQLPRAHERRPPRGGVD